LNPELLSLAGSLGISDRITQLENPGSELLEALYNCAVALLYPSRFEGFGWPVAEAQACGCTIAELKPDTLPPGATGELAFTLNLGLRWEYFGPIYEKFGNLDVAVVGPAPNPLTGASVRVGGNLYNSSYHNVGPQLGFAWSPGSLPLVGQEMNNRLVIRGGFGIGYSREEQAFAEYGNARKPQRHHRKIRRSNRNCSARIRRDVRDDRPLPPGPTPSPACTTAASASSRERTVESGIRGKAQPFPVRYRGR
jgi:hypothetical protein